MQRIPVKEFMASDLVAAGPDMLLTDLVQLLREHRLRGMPVVDDSGSVVGAVSETDLFLKEHPVPFSTEKVPSLLGQVIDKQDVDQVELCQQMTVGQVMTENVVSVDEDATLEDVALLMHERHLSMVPVLRGGSLVGVVRRNDVLQILYGQTE